MSYTAAAKLPSLAIFQWANVANPIPALAQPLSDLVTTTLYFTAPPLDHAGAVISMGFLMGIKNDQGYVETIYVPSGSLSVDGLTATNVIRGVRLEGLDYTTGGTNTASTFKAGDPVFCNISAVNFFLLVNALQGGIATGANLFQIGTNAAGNIFIYAANGATNKPFIEYNGTQWVYSNDGVSSTNFGTGAGLTGGTGITISSGVVTLNMAASGAAGGVQEATDSQVGAGTATGSTGFRLYINPGSTTVSTRTQNKVVVTDSSGGVNSNLLNFDRSYAPSSHVVADTVSASDIANMNNLLYLNDGPGGDGQWHKITSTTSTWYKRLGICLDSVTGGNSGARILLKGEISGLSIPNINPTFSGNGTGTDNTLGDNTTALRSFLVDNSSGAEAVVTGGVISARQQGTPAGPLWIGLVLEQSDQSNTAACFYDSTNHIARGAVIASATIAQASFSGVDQNLSFSFGGSVKIPANSRVYLVCALQGTQSSSNYYFVQSGSAAANIPVSSPSTWSGSTPAANYSLTVTSTSPIGYSVKAYTGTNGGWGLTGGSGQSWNRSVGTVISSTTILFDPNQNVTSFGQGSDIVSATVQGGYDLVTLGVCPNTVKIDVGSSNFAATPQYAHVMGYLRGDSVLNKYNPSSPGQNSSGSTSFLKGQNSGVTGTNNALMINNGAGNFYTQQNTVHIARLETGCYVYIGYPSGANYISAGNGTFTSLVYSFVLTATT